MTTRPRRALCLTSNFPRWEGDATTPFVLHLAQDLAEWGWQVDVLAPHAPGAQRRETLGGVHVERFRYLLPESAQTVCYQGGALVNLRKRPVEKLKLPALVGAEGWATWRRLMRGTYDLLHSHWVLPQGFVGTLASRAARVPHVVTVHGGDLFALRGPWMARFKRAALRGAQVVTVNSSFTQRAVQELCPELATVVCIPMGVRVDPLSVEERDRAERIRREHGQPGQPLLVFVGRLVEEKGLGDVLAAVALLRKSYPGLRLLVVGEGQDRNAFEAWVTEQGLGEMVSFAGWVASDQVRSYMAAADVFVGPSRTGPDGWVEAQGLTFLEAMVAGTAVVATRLGGIPDAVRHEETGLLVEERRPDQIAEAIRRLWSDEVLRSRLIEQARRWVGDGFSRRSSARRFAEVFDSLLVTSSGQRTSR